MKTIVTHISPDLDAIAATWLIKSYLPGWENAEISLVPAGTTLNSLAPDANKNIIHVDTGLGRFDHHQTNEYTSATKLVFEFLLEKNLFMSKEIKPLESLVGYVNETDHFGEVFYPDADADRYDLMLRQLIDGLKVLNRDINNLFELVYKILDAALIIFKNKESAKEEIKKGLVFRSYIGKSLALETKNEETVKLALKKGFLLVIRRNPEGGFTRIKTFPDLKFSLKPVYEKIMKFDKNGSWFYHISGHMLLNGSSGNPKLKATSLSLNQIIEIVKSV